MKDTSRVLALSLYLPNCDRKGFFKRKQVSFVSDSNIFGMFRSFVVTFHEYVLKLNRTHTSGLFDHKLPTAVKSTNV